MSEPISDGLLLDLAGFFEGGRTGCLLTNDMLAATTTALRELVALRAEVASASALLRRMRRAAVKMGETKFEAWDAALDELLVFAMSDELSLILIKDALSDADSGSPK